MHKKIDAKLRILKSKNVPHLLQELHLNGVHQDFLLDGEVVDYYNSATNEVLALADPNMYCFDGTTLNAVGLLKM